MGAQDTNNKSTEEFVTSQVPQRITEKLRKWFETEVVLPTIGGIFVFVSMMLPFLFTANGMVAYAFVWMFILAICMHYHMDIFVNNAFDMEGFLTCIGASIVRLFLKNNHLV